VRQISGRHRFAFASLGVVVCVVVVGTYFRILPSNLIGQVAQARAQVPQEVALTPGMLFGPIPVDSGEHLELCSSYLGPEPLGLTQFVHFRNLTTGEVTKVKKIIIHPGAGACAQYWGKGVVVGLTRGEGPPADWVSPSNALIGTMSLLNPRDNAQITVLGVAKLWAVGF